jgi:hypothetical protein
VFSGPRSHMCEFQVDAGKVSFVSATGRRRFVATFEPHGLVLAHSGHVLTWSTFTGTATRVPSCATGWGFSASPRRPLGADAVVVWARPAAPARPVVHMSWPITSGRRRCDTSTFEALCRFAAFSSAARAAFGIPDRAQHLADTLAASELRAAHTTAEPGSVRHRVWVASCDAVAAFTVLSGGRLVAGEPSPDIERCTSIVASRVGAQWAQVARDTVETIVAAPRWPFDALVETALTAETGAPVGRLRGDG